MLPLQVLSPDFLFGFEEGVLTFFFYAAGLAEDAETTTSSHIEEMVKEVTQLEGVEASVGETTSEGAIAETREPSALPEKEVPTEAGEALTLQDSPKGSLSLDLPGGKEVLIF